MIDDVDHVARLRRLGKIANARHALILAAESEEHVVAVQIDDLRPMLRAVLQPVGIRLQIALHDLIERHAA